MSDLQTKVSTWTHGSPHFGQDRPSFPELPPFTPLPEPEPDPLERFVGSVGLPPSGGVGGGGTEPGGTRPNKIPAEENSVQKKIKVIKLQILFSVSADSILYRM